MTQRRPRGAQRGGTGRNPSPYYAHFAYLSHTNISKTYIYTSFLSSLSSPMLALSTSLLLYFFSYPQVPEVCLPRLVHCGAVQRPTGPNGLISTGQRSVVPGSSPPVSPDMASFYHNSGLGNIAVIGGGVGSRGERGGSDMVTRAVSRSSMSPTLRLDSPGTAEKSGNGRTGGGASGCVLDVACSSFNTCILLKRTPANTVDSATPWTAQAGQPAKAAQAAGGSPVWDGRTDSPGGPAIFLTPFPQ